MEHDPSRAMLFETAAANYDLYRPSYPMIVMEQMLELAIVSPSSRLLEIGCGTGKATVLLAAKGLSIDCVEPGDTLLAIARSACKAWPCVRFIPGKFEDIELPRYQYDLLYSAQAFHWIDPGMRWRKCDSCLRAGGSIALLYNYPLLPERQIEKDLSSRILQESSGAMKPWNYEEAIQKWQQEIAATGLFGLLNVRRHRWSRELDAEEYVGLFHTFSDFLSMPVETQNRIADAIRRSIEANGGSIDHRYETVLLHARKDA